MTPTERRGLLPAMASMIGPVIALQFAFLLFAAPALAGVAPQPIAPADGATVDTGAAAAPTFSVDPGQGATGYLWINVSTSPAVNAAGVIGSDVTLGSLLAVPGSPAWTWTPTRYTFPGYWLVTPGTYYWQPYRISYVDDPDGFQEGAIRRLVVNAPAQLPTPTPVPSPVPTATPTPPPDPFAGLSTQLIPRSIGTRDPHWSFFVSTTGLPAGIGAGRWRALAQTAGARWGMRYRGTVPWRPSVGDGESDVGFGKRPPGVLGTEIDLVRSVYRRYRKPHLVCDERRRGIAHASHCRYSRRRLIRVDYLDSDVIIDRATAWQAGPDLPDLVQYDLQTVLLHEMGHLAGNLRHAPRCRPTPMVEALDTGEWWHSTTDWHFRSCRSAPTLLARSSVVTHEVRTRSVIIGPGRAGRAKLRRLEESSRHE